MLYRVVRMGPGLAMDHPITAKRPLDRPAREAVSTTSRPPAGFTLIEVMVVVVVIALLAGLVAPNVFRNLGVARESTAQSQAAMLAAALDAYRLDNGRYPSETQGLDALWAEPETPPLPRSWAGPYLRRPPPLDPWDNPYHYTLDEAGRFRLATLGADGQEGGRGEDADALLW